jgi:RNA polymerase subunit RPABC4/transcription elongation factor Spt4
MRTRAAASPKAAALTCFACQTVLSADDIICPQCNAPQPLES